VASGVGAFVGGFEGAGVGLGVGWDFEEGIEKERQKLSEHHKQIDVSSSLSLEECNTLTQHFPQRIQYADSSISIQIIFTYMFSRGIRRRRCGRVCWWARVNITHSSSFRTHATTSRLPTSRPTITIQGTSGTNCIPLSTHSFSF